MRRPFPSEYPSSPKLPRLRLVERPESRLSAGMIVARVAMILFGIYMSAILVGILLNLWSGQ